MPHDPLTDIVKSLSLIGGVFLEGEFTAPWAIASRITEEDCQPFLPLPKQVIAYHVVTEGEMIVMLDDGETHWARSGDIVFLPSNAWHTLASDHSVCPVSSDDLILPSGESGLARIQFGGGGAATRILCGFIASDSEPNTLLDTLPDTLIIRVEDVATQRWLEASIAMAARELTAGRVSSTTVMTQLAELLLVEALRAYIEKEGAPRGWLAGMAEPRIAQSLARIHKNLSSPVAVDALAREASMSRSAFVQKFTDLLGVGPAGYAREQRMAAARLLLRDTELSIAQIGYRVGYDAPEAFSRAFKRETGQAPADWRAAHSSD